MSLPGKPETGGAADNDKVEGETGGNDTETPSVLGEHGLTDTKVTVSSGLMHDTKPTRLPELARLLGMLAGGYELPKKKDGDCQIIEG